MTDRLIGQSIPRFDLKDKVTGKALYPGDFKLEKQVILKVLFAERPHAIIKSIDTSAAEAVNGVLMVLTAKDVPCNEYGLIKKDQPVLCGPGSSAPFADRVRFVGDQVALVIAENEDIAIEALKQIKVEYQDLPVIDSIASAMQDGAFLVHPELKSPEFCHFRIRRGDVEAGFAQADVIIESNYETPMQEHAYLQPEAGVAYYDEEERVTVVVGGQWTHKDREEIAHALNLPEDKVRVIYPAIGGAFGGREDMSVQIILALAVVKLNEAGIRRPVKIVWDRRESIIGHHKRHAYKIHTKWGASRDGKLTAVEAQIISDGGAYLYTSNKVLGNSTLMITGPYFVPNVKVDSRSVATNNIPGGAFRGFGGPQACFAAEMQMNKLAQALGMDPVEIRLKNTLKEGQPGSVGSPLPKGISINHVIESCAQAMGWKEANGKWMMPATADSKEGSEVVYGLGIAAGLKNVGFSFGAPENCWAAIKIVGDDKIEKVIVKHAGAEVGQGAHSLFVQMAAAACGVSLDQVELIASDTAETGNSGSVSASRMTFMAGNAILGAAREALSKWQSEERPAEATFVYRPPETSPFHPETGECYPNFSYGYAADAVLVSVNRKTGKVLIRKVIISDDVGRAINPQQVRGQIEGAVVQAAGYTLIENFIQEKGLVRTDSLATYLIPTIMDIPERTESIILEDGDPLGPWGARGVGEMPYLPFAPAVLSAVFNATGVWFDRFPLTEECVLRGLGSLPKKE